MKNLKRASVVFTSMLLLSALASASEAPEFKREVIQSPDRPDADRILIVESQPNDRKLLLVIEKLHFTGMARPMDALTESVLFRKSFGAHQTVQLRQTLEQFHHRALSQNSIRFNVRSFDFTDARPLWVATKAWTLDEEKAFGQWVNTTVDTHILEGGGVLVDCADTAVTLRWIYAREHQLPVANRLGGGSLVGHFTRNSEWDRLPSNADWKQDERFKAALRYVLDGTYTHSILGDLYPVQITADYVTPGTIHLNLYNDTTGHTETIKVVGREPNYCSQGQCITTIWGNEPSREVIFYSGIFDVNVDANHGGYLRWRWPEKNSAGNWALRSGARMPGYSLEQYQFPGVPASTFQEWVEEKIGFAISPHTKIDTRVATIYYLIQQRSEVVVEGIAHCLGQNCAPGTDLYDAYSTPSRDRRIKDMAADLRHVIAGLPAGDDYGTYRVGDYSDNYLAGFELESVASAMLNENGMLDAWTSDPRDPWMNRWGVGVATPTAEAMVVAQYGMITKLFEVRDNKVNQGYFQCASGRTCDLQSPAIRALFTQAEDNLIRSMKVWWNTYPAQHATEIPATRMTQLQEGFDGASVVYVPACRHGNQFYCTVGDFLNASNHDVEQMTASPADTLAARWGLPEVAVQPAPSPGPGDDGGDAH